VAVTIQRQFPNDPTKRIRLPNYPGPEGEGSWRLPACLPMTVPVWDPTNPVGGADADGYFPIQAVYIDCDERRVKAPGCSYGAYLNDGMSRCSVWLDSVEFQPPFPVPGGTPLDFKIKGSDQSSSQGLAVGTVIIPQPTTFGEPVTTLGLLAFVASGLVSQYELWARIAVAIDAPPRNPLTIKVAFIVDREGQPLSSFYGSIVTGGSSQLPKVTGP
jgi:hypothetical protein